MHVIRLPPSNMKIIHIMQISNISALNDLGHKVGIDDLFES